VSETDLFELQNLKHRNLKSAQQQRQTRDSKMNDRIIKKYVKDLDGLLEELRNAPFVVQPEFEMGEHAVTFLFGMISKYLRFKDIQLGHLKVLGNRLDATAMLENDEELFIEFESRSNHISLHKSFTDYSKFVTDQLWNWKDEITDHDAMLISLRGIIAKPLSPSYLAEQRET
jgi:hypothetical protein